MTTEETLKALIATYQADKANSDILKKANNAIVSLFPNVKDNNENAWHALDQKQAIKQFYIDYVTDDYAKNKGIDIDTAQKDVINALHDFFNTIKGNPNAGGKDAYNIFLQENINHDTTNDFKCDLLPASNKMTPLNFKKSTLNIIAGRPSAGKTTALTSFAMYALRNTDKNVLFVTSEETTNQLITRFIKNQFCNNCIESNKGELLLKGASENYIDETFIDIISKDYANPSLFEDNGVDMFSYEVLKAGREVKKFIESGRLQLFDLDKTTTFEELKDRLQELERHSVVIIDYIQNLPYAPAGTPNNDRLESLRRQTYTINQIIKANELIGIAGAQFNRVGANEHNPDSLELSNIGENDEIAKKTVIAIGLGRRITEDNKPIFFYRIMKARFSSISIHFELEDFYIYSYLRAKVINDNLVPFTIGSNRTPAGTGKGTRKDKDNEPAIIETAGPINRKAPPKIF